MKNVLVANHLGPHYKKLFDDAIFSQSQTNEVEKGTIEERHGTMLDDNRPRNETRGRTQSNSRDQFSSIWINDLNIEKVRERK